MKSSGITTLTCTIAKITISVALFVALILGLIGTSCPGDVLYGRKNPFCSLVTSDGDSGLKTTIWFFLIPLFSISVLVFVVDWLRCFWCCISPGDAVAISKCNTNGKFNKFWVSWVIGGDPKVKLWCILIVLIPAIIICLDGTLSFEFPAEMERPQWQSRVYGLALSSGYASVAALSFFMIPVAKQSVLLAAFGWSPIQALSLHIWAGRVCFICAMIHGILFCAVYGIGGMGEGKGFFYSVVKALIPARDCFRLAGLFSFKDAYKFDEGCNGRESTSMSNATMSNTTFAPSASPTNFDDKKPCCYGYVRNFTGLISLIALILLTLTSLNSIRRWNYRFFYMSHIVTGSVMLLFAIFHFRFIVVYILPSLLYYFCTTSPVMIQMIAKFFLDKGCKLEESTVIGNSNGCAEMVFPKTVACSIVEGRQAAPYVRICVPEISLLWYPFTVATTPHGRNSHLKILFRKYGYFTTNLEQRLKENQRPPIILIDGYYFGPDWVTISMRHDEVLLIAGGIGITPFLSMIRMLHDTIISMGSYDKVRLRKIRLDWFCRDEGLIRHVVNNHFFYLEETCKEDVCKLNGRDSDDQPFSIEIQIHFTGREVGDMTEFCLEEPVLTNSEATRASSENSDSSQHFTRELPTLSGNADPDQGVNQISSNEKKNLMQSGANTCHHPLRALDTFDDHPTDVNPLSSSESTQLENLTSVEHSIKRKYPDSQGFLMEHARFSLGVQSGWSLLCFIICFIGGLAIHDYYYTNYIVVYVWAFPFRAYSTYAVAIWSILVGIIFEIIHRYLRQGSSSHQLLIEDVEEGPEIDQNSFEKNRLPFTGRVGEKLVIHIRINNGRPLLDGVCDGVVHSEIPGAFFCGPSKLLTSVQTHIQKSRRIVKGSCSAKCCIYHEEFEM